MPAVIGGANRAVPPEIRHARSASRGWVVRLRRNNASTEHSNTVAKTKAGATDGESGSFSSLVFDGADRRPRNFRALGQFRRRSPARRLVSQRRAG